MAGPQSMLDVAAGLASTGFPDPRISVIALTRDTSSPTTWFRVRLARHPERESSRKAQTVLLPLRPPDHCVNTRCASQPVTEHVTSFSVCP